MTEPNFPSDDTRRELPSLCPTRC